MSAQDDALQRAILQFRDERDWGKIHTPSNLARSISIEAAELLECFQWNEKDYDLEQVKEEIADIYIYLSILRHDLELDLEQVVSDKLAANRKKYPIDKCKGKSTKYNRL